MLDLMDKRLTDNFSWVDWIVQERQDHRRNIDPAVLRYAIQNGNPVDANHKLTVLIEKIIVTGNNAVVVWRD